MKIIGMKKLCSATRELAPVGYAPRLKIQVNLDIRTGRLYWADVIGNGYIQYNDDDLVYVCTIEHPMTMAEIKTLVLDCLAWLV